MAKSMVKDVNRLREQWRTAKRAHDHETNLTQKREELENHIQQLSFDLNQKELAAHRLHDYSPEQAKSLLVEIDRKENILKEMSAKKKEIDALLDTYENVETNELLQRELTAAIIERHPEKKAGLDFVTGQLRHYRDLEANANEGARLLGQIQLLLAEAWNERTRMRRRGILSYLFGVNPYFVITQRLQAVALLAGNHLSFFENDDEVREFLEELKREAQKRWGYRHLDRFLPASLGRVEGFVGRYHLRAQENRRHVAEFEAKLDRWLLEE